MKFRIGLFALLALASLIGVSVWATGHQGIALAIADLRAAPAGGNNPWFVATLFDAYFAFLWFWLWTCVRTGSWAARLGWLVAILLGGNIAMAVYVLIALWRLPPGADIGQFLTNGPKRSGG